jgi:hypothetical protein
MAAGVDAWFNTCAIISPEVPGLDRITSLYGTVPAGINNPCAGSPGAEVDGDWFCDPFWQNGEKPDCRSMTRVDYSKSTIDTKISSAKQKANRQKITDFFSRLSGPRDIPGMTMIFNDKDRSGPRS